MRGVELGPTTEAPDLEGLTHEERVEAIVEWFEENFEDPAESTPYESAEGGYQWIWGGPHDAREEIWDAFGDSVTEEDVEGAADEIQRDGLFDWAPNQGRMIEVEDGEEDADDDRLSLQDRIDALRGQLDDLEGALSHLSPDVPQIGHNHPPEGMRIGLEKQDLDEAQKSINEIRIELDKANAIAEADSVVLERAEGRFRILANKIKSWAVSAGRWIGLGVGGSIVTDLWEDPVALYHKIETIAGTLSVWAHSLHALF